MEIEQYFPFSNLSDTEFISVIQGDNHLYPLSVLNSLVFSNSEDNITNHNVEHLSEPIMPQPECDYIFCTDELQHNFLNNSLKIFSYNISSVPQHLDSFFEQCFNPSGVQVDVVGLCETRLNDNICNLYTLDNYSSFFQNKSTLSGGVCIYLYKNFQGVKISNACLQLPHIETLFIEILKPFRFIVGVVYRPPNSSFSDFLESMENILELLSNLKTECYLMGDYNINLLKTNDNLTNFTNLFYSYGLFQTITKPTRVTHRSATLIDHIWTNNANNYIKSGILYTSISDHFPVYSLFLLPDHNVTSYVNISKRIYSEDKVKAFKDDLKKCNWNLELIDVESVNNFFDSYMDKFQDLYNHHFPVKSFAIKEKHYGKPYITSGIIKSIKHRNKLQKLYAKWPLTYETQFKKYRNMLTIIIRTAKDNYLRSKLYKESGDAKKTWKTINTLLGKKRENLLTSINFGDKKLFNNKEIAEEFNNYFGRVACELASDIQPPAATFESYLPDPVPFSFFLKPTSEQEISEIIKQTKLTSPGYDGINIKIIKECSDEISPILTLIVNKCFREGSFPKRLQIAKIIPIYKKGERSIHANYRPVSILPSFSKIFEKLFAIRLNDYFTKFSLFTDSQYGFRPTYSTELAIHQLSQSIYNTLDNKQCQITVFCDLSKAFDTISHSILLRKLDNYGIRGKANDFLKSYLGSRNQFTVYNNASSSLKQISHGVPQGSILGPLLFLIYINDLVLISKNVKFLLFADDTTIFIQGSNIVDMMGTLNSELTKLSNWIRSNRLTINVSKTFYMVSCGVNNNLENINVKIDNFVLSKVNHIKFLGVIIDEKLTWKQHLLSVCTKISQITGILYRIRNCLTPECIRLVYLSAAYPHFLYCSAIWGGAFKTLLDGLFLAQKKIIRIMYFKPKYEHTNNLFNEHKIMKLPDIVFSQTCLFVFKSLYVFPVKSDFEFPSHNVNTRRPMDVKTPQCRTVHAQRSVCVRGVRSWNSLPQHIKEINSINLFKTKIKSSVFHSYNH